MSSINQTLPKITIVTVTYNAEAYLEQTIQSVLGQNYPNLEYIIIDGASTDGTVDIIKKYERQIAYWVSEPDDGIYYAMNKGIDAATGEWINFMNAGDSFCESSTLLDVYGFGNLDSWDIIYGDRINVSKDGVGVLQKASSLEMFHYSMPFGHQSAFVKTSLHKKYKFDLFLSLSSDYDFFLKIYIKNYKFLYTGKPIANFLLFGISQQNKVKSNTEAIFSLYRATKNINYVESSVFFESLFFNESLSLFSKIMDVYKSHNQIVVYGHSVLGRYFINFFREKIVVCLDSFEEGEEEGYSVVHPSKLCNYTYDIVVIALLGREKLIEQNLIETYGVLANKIVVLRDFNRPRLDKN